MELDDCQWVHCFLLPETENECRQQAEESFRDEEEETFLQELGPLKEAEEENFLQELGPVKNAIEEEDSKVVIEELLPMRVEETEKVAVNEQEKQVDLKEEVPMCKAESPAPAVSLDRLKSLLASQLKACLSRVPTTASSVSPSVPQETNGRTSTKGSLLKCDHCARYFTKEDLAAHLHTEICQTSFHCALCSRKFNTKAQFTLHICISEKAGATKKRFECSICSQTFLRSDSLMNHIQMHLKFTCSVCGEQFMNNHKLVSHLMTHKMDGEEKPSVQSLKPEEALQLPEDKEFTQPTVLPSKEEPPESSDVETNKKTPVQLNRIESKDKELMKPWRFQIKTLELKSEDRTLVQRQKGRSIEKTLAQSQISRLKLRKSSELSLHPKVNEEIPMRSSRLKPKVSKQGSKEKTSSQPSKPPSKVKASARASRLRCKENRSKLESEKKLPVSSSKPEPEVKSLPLLKRLEEKVNCKQKSEQPPVRKFRADKIPNTPAINGHVKKHHVCSECKMHFKSVHSLKLHAKKHKLLTCCTCARTFAKTRDLAVHMKVHKQVMKCDVCKKVLEDSTAHKVHMKSHQYSCKMCKNKWFNSKLQLQAHVRTVHNRQTRSSLRVRGK
ncbi:oocyte zinc finger protein XlCOF28-like isoform X2 [Anabrus simplex]|uniref:oocyte zinc finger protein XlCOF28-like isoform X2 n=1 Tax=Anabrus simplex TaxID=316456 RepID=UPI0035A2FC54